MKTKSITKKEAQSKRRWFVIDARGLVLGRLASRVAFILQGKGHVYYAPHVDTGDFVVVLNAAEVVVTGRKETQKIYYHHTGWVGGIKARTVRRLREETPEDLIKHAVWGMLKRKKTLARAMFRKLKVYAGAHHPHEAQRPEPLTV